MNDKKNVENVDNERAMDQEQASLNASAKVSIDDRLGSPAQRAVRQAVRALPEDVPSLAWRSSLNERLAMAAAARRSRRRRWLFGGSSFAGLALAAGLTLVLFSPKQPAPPAVNPSVTAAIVQNPAPSLEDQLLSSHNDSVTSQDVVGAGLTSQEVQSTEDESEGQQTS